MPTPVARVITAGIVAGHILLIAAYSMPGELVPVRLRYWSQAYARVLFHQDWRLFAPDPPACGCAITYRRSTEEEWKELSAEQSGFIWRRMAANVCRLGEVSLAADGMNGSPEALIDSFVSMLRLAPGERALIRFRRDSAAGTACPGQVFAEEYTIERGG